MKRKAVRTILGPFKANNKRIGKEQTKKLNIGCKWT